MNSLELTENDMALNLDLDVVLDDQVADASPIEIQAQALYYWDRQAQLYTPDFSDKAKINLVRGWALADLIDAGLIARPEMGWTTISHLPESIG